jgi:hypothetical protein
MSQYTPPETPSVSKLEDAVKTYELELAKEKHAFQLQVLDKVLTLLKWTLYLIASVLGSNLLTALTP